MEEMDKDVLLLFAFLILVSLSTTLHQTWLRAVNFKLKCLTEIHHLTSIFNKPKYLQAVFALSRMVNNPSGCSSVHSYDAYICPVHRQLQTPP